MSYQSNLMLWALWVADSLLHHDHDLDLKRRPLPGQWHLSGLLPQVCVLSHRRPLSWLTLDLQHELKWFFVTTFMAFFAKSWAIPVRMYRTAFTTRFISATFVSATSMRTARFTWAAVSTALLTAFKTFNYIDCRQLGRSSVGLVTVKIFHCHLVFFGVLK